MTSIRRNAIETLATRIREFVNVETPIDLTSVVQEKLNGHITTEKFLDSDISGKVEKYGESFIITVNAANSDSRKNFTIAHELGHLFLHMGYIVDPKQWDAITEYIDSAKYRLGYSEEEYEANQFAGSFLMPEKEYRTFVDTNIENNSISIRKISSHFNVSDDAALTRGKWLGIFAWG